MKSSYCRKNLIRLILFTFIFFAFFFNLSNSSTTKIVEAQEQEVSDIHILVLNAYHFTYPWTFNQNIGINQRLEEVYPEAVIYTEFLDWKRFPDEAHLAELLVSYEIKYKNTPIDLILTTDDMGLIFALEHRDSYFSQAPIVFGGIIEFTAKEIIGDEKNVTGVYELMDPKGALALMHELQPEIEEIVLIHDLSESGIRTGQNLLRAIENFEAVKAYSVRDISQRSFDDLLDEVARLHEKSVVFMVSYNSSIDGQLEKPEVFGNQLARASQVPVYTIDEFLFGQGVVGGSFLSGELHGQQMAELGIEILQGKAADTIAHIAEATAYLGVDEEVLNRFDLNVKNVNETPLIINQHFSFYETYKLEVWIGISVMSMLLLILIVLILNIIKRKHSESVVLYQKMELQEINEELLASEEELRAQNEELQNYQRQLTKEAHYDALTDLPNRFNLAQVTAKLFLDAKEQGHKLAFYFVDLDNFRYVNNTHGHSFGDELLKNIALRLMTIPQIYTAVRLGGDEFVVIAIIESDDYETKTQAMANQLRQHLFKPYEVHDIVIPITFSIGYSIYPDDGETVEELILEADMAMYETKKERRPYARRYDSSIKEKYETAFHIISSLKDAYENKEFYLHFQPQIEIETNQIVGFEALLRWHSPKFGQVSPARFIPLAESSGFITTLGHCVIRQALIFVKQIKPYMLEPFKVAVNISVIQLFEDDFIADIVSLLEEEDVDATYLQLEITESIMIDSYELCIERLKVIRSLGISLSLDDFGTGYSSLSYLHHLPISEIKIDKTFIDGILSNHLEHKGLIDTILTLAKASDLCVVAEGVEDGMQVAYLKSKGCQRIQGYYYSKPLPLEDIIVYCQEKSKKDDSKD